MAEFYTDFIWSMTLTVFIFTLLAVLLGALWWYFVKSEQWLRDEKETPHSTAKRTVLTVNNVEDVRQLLLDEKCVPASLHDKALQKIKYRIWNEEDSRTLKDFLQKMISEKGTMENHLLEATKLLIQHLKKKGVGLLDFSEIMSIHALNLVYAVTFGKSFELDDERFLKIRKELDDIIKLWPKFNPDYQQPLESEEMDFTAAKGEFLTRMKQTIMRHTPVTDAKQQVLLDHLMIVKEDQKNLDDDVAEYLLVFFVSGYESLAKFFSSASLLLAENSEVQEEMRENLENNISNTELSAKLPVVTATFNELLRMVKPVPFTTRCTKSVVSNNDEQNCELTKIDLAAILDDDKYWECPKTFNPLRFLDSTRNITQKEAFLPLSIGPRSCPGLILVEMTSFLFLTSIAQAYKLSKPDSMSEECSNCSHILIHVSSRCSEGNKEEL